MSSNVFANGREISCKSDGNHCNGAMPDVCLTPPPPPAGPLPIPYPNFSDDSGTDDGTRNVMIGGKQVGQKNKSTFKSSKGNEAATRSQGMGVITHNISGATSHTAWSFTVKAENENITRHLDMTTHNHGSPASNGGITIKVGQLKHANPESAECEELKQRNADTRKSIGQKGETSTVTNCKYTPKKGASQYVWSSSRKLSALKQAGVPGTYMPGLEYNRQVTIKNQEGKYRSAKKAEETNMCEEATENRKFQYNNDINVRNPHTSHTEPRIIESLMANGDVSGSTLKMAIDWQSEAGKQDKPCDDCHRVLCAAAACGMTIILCREGKPKPCEKDLSVN